MIIGMRTDEFAERRGRLLDWLNKTTAGSTLTIGQIAFESGVYDGMRDQRAKCLSDLRRLEDEGVTTEYPGKPPRWGLSNA
jgi:hypothetical protein